MYNVTSRPKSWGDLEIEVLRRVSTHKIPNHLIFLALDQIKIRNISVVSQNHDLLKFIEKFLSIFGYLLILVIDP